MENFYSDLEKHAFWKSGLADVSPLNVPNIYKKNGPLERIGKLEQQEAVLPSIFPAI